MYASKTPKENTYLHLGKWQWCQISTASSCQAPLYSKLKYDSPINTSLSWSFSPTALFQTSFEVCLPPSWLKGVCVSEERRYCQHGLIILFSPTLQATKFRQTPGSRHLWWEQVNTCTNCRSRINGKAHLTGVFIFVWSLNMCYTYFILALLMNVNTFSLLCMGFLLPLNKI